MSNLPKVIVKDKEDIKTNHINWDEYFMSIAILSSLRSKILLPKLEQQLFLTNIKFYLWDTTECLSVSMTLKYLGLEKVQVN